ncbi:MAG: hypothetical protein R2834_06390 [Rhodothermales bacterium]
MAGNPIISRRTQRVLAAFVLLLCLTSLDQFVMRSQAQALPIDARLVHIINYQAGVVRAQWIPYGRRWAIQGTTIKTENEIKVVVGEIEGRGTRDRQKSCWVNPPDVYTDVFRLVFEPLDIGRRYDLKLDFYGGFDVNILKPALDRAYEETMRTAKETYPYVKQQVIRDIFTQNIETELAEVFKRDEVVLVRNVVDDNCEVVGEDKFVPSFDIEPMLLNEVAESVLGDVRISRSEDILEELTQSNRVMMQDQTFTDLMIRLKKEENMRFLQAGDVEALRASIVSNRMPQEDVVARLYATSRACRGDAGFPEDECGMLGDIVDRSYQVIREMSLQSADEYAPIRTRILNSLGEHLSGLYTAVANTRVNALNWEGAEATSDRARISTTIGFGAAALNLAPSTVFNPGVQEAQAFGVAALKFYPFAVDKQLPSPYFGRELLARTSLVAGLILRRRLQFESQNLKGATAGLIPLVGGGFDITKNFTVQLGMIFFRQPSFTPGDNSSEFKGAPSLSIAFDFDGVNRVRDAIRDLKD